MKSEEIVEQLERDCAGFLLLALDKSTGETVARSSAVPLTISMVAAQKQNGISARDVLKAIQVMEDMTNGKMKSARGRKPGSKQKKPVKETKPEKSEPAVNP